MTQASPQSYVRLAGALLLSFVFGSIHDFGLFLRPLQQTLDANLILISSGYSVAIVFLTIGVLAAPLALWRFSPSVIAVMAGITGSAGLVAAALFADVFALIAGYGVLFGFSNGVAYALLLQQAAQALPSRPGLGLGVATATYGLGMAAFAPMIEWLITRWDPITALLCLAACILMSSTAAAALFAGQKYAQPAPYKDTRWPPGTQLGRLWSIYLLTATGSLMVVAHGEAIVAGSGTDHAMAQWAPSCFAIGNILGSFAGGIWAGKRALGRALAPPTLLLCLCLFLLPTGTDSVYQLVLMALIGSSYGFIISAIPAVIRRDLGEAAFAPAFGLVFTAWGCAGLLGPSLGSAFKQVFLTYDQAILCAAGFSILAFCLTSLTPNLINQRRLS